MGSVPRRSSSFDVPGFPRSNPVQSPLAIRGGETRGWQSGRRPMTRIVSKFGIAAALTLGLLSTAAAQATTKKPTTKKAAPTASVPITKEQPGEVVTVHDTVRVFVRDTFTVYRRDTLTLTGPTVTRWDTVQVVNVPGWLSPGNGLYFGLGAGSYYPS